MKLSGKENALFIAGLICVFQLTYAQTPDAAVVEGAAQAETASTEEAHTDDSSNEYVRLIHIERPIALDKIENSAPETFSASFAKASLTSQQTDPNVYSQLSPQQQAYLQRLEKIEDFDQVLEDLEIEGGAWSVQIAQELADLGNLLQAQGHYEESIEVLDRAVHINRVNNGLFSPSQVPLIKKVVQSHIALGQWAEADDRQQYAFYVQTRAYSIDDPRMIDVFDNLARWNIATFYRGIDEDPNPRLAQTYLLYRAATDSVVTHFGTKDPRYLPLLHKVASAADMMNRYSPEGTPIGTRMNPDLRMTSEFAGGSLRPQGRQDTGADALESVVAYYNDPELPKTAENLIARARAQAELGDWYLLRDRRQAALRAYEEAYEQLVAAENGETLVSQVFGEIVFLPTYSVFDEQRKEAYGIGPDSGARMGYVDLAFDVNQYGRLSNFEVLAMQPDDLERADIQVITSVRSNLVRPKIVDGDTISSEIERYRFNFWY